MFPYTPTDSGRIPVTLGAQFKRHAARFGVGLLLLALYQVAQWWFDNHFMSAINAATSGKDALALDLGVLLVVVALGAFVARVLSRLVVFNAGRIAEYELRRALLHRLQRLGPAFFQRMSSGEIMSRVTNDLVQVRLLLGFGVLNVINTPFALVSALAVTLPISGPLTLAALAPLPLLFLVTRSFSRQLYSRTLENQEAIGAMSEQVRSSIAGVRVVRSFALEEQEIRAFEKTNQAYLEKSLALARLRGSFGPVMQAITAVGALVVFWYGGYLMLQGDLDAGSFLAFYRALGRLTWPLMSLGFLVGLVQRGRAAYTRLAQIYEAVPDIVDGAETPNPAAVGRLEVRHLSFSHGDSQVLDDVSFSLEPGASLAVVGRTGSGKSTLAELLPRLSATPVGSVFLDGQDVCDLPLGYVRTQIGYAQQDAFLFSTTVARNIGFALDEPDTEAALLGIRDAARRVHVLDEMLALPDGLDTVVGERGVQLSGGQKQRVALAGALLVRPRILVLDDPLSAVDARTERRILDAIDRERAERGVILVTHRVAAASRCDRIIVLDAGRIVESGTHEQLLTCGGIYAKFAEEQRIQSELEKLGEVEFPPAQLGVVGP
jgi:ATP-binding cassette subfamily B protein